MIQYCIDQARQLPIVRGHKRLFAVVLDKRNRLVSQGSNSYTKTSSRQYRAAKRVGEPAKQCLHAEAVAIFRSQGRGVKLIVARVDAEGNACMSKPCRVCCELIKMHGGIISIEHTI
jgi:deoxycytidylate deaminase